MKCLKCHNAISQKVNCLFCKGIFCSYNCMESHVILSHKNNLMINIPNNDKILNKKYYSSITEENKNYNFDSPYIIPGILNKQRKYDEKYNLNNFISIFENEKPKIIGGGSFGQVFLVMNTINKKLYAIKHMTKKSLSTKLNSFEGIYKEIYIQSRIDHPNILPILYVKETSTDFHLVLEYASGGSLFHFIRKNKYLDEALAFRLFIQVINAVYFLHKNNLIHRDIKPENILLFDNNIIKLCDFGWCVKLEEGQQRGTFCGTTEYMSPELVNHEEYSKEIDVWSLGVLLYEMVHGYSPFRPDKQDFNAKDVIENIRLHKLKFNNDVSEECKELIYHLLDEDPIKRYKIEDIFNSDFVKFYEKRKYGFPDQYLFEKYKFKLSKVQTTIYSKNKNKNNQKYHISHNKSYSNNIITNNLEKIDDNLIEDNLSTNEKNLGLIYTKKNNNIPLSLSDINLNSYKSNSRRLKKNNTSQYFHPLNIIENKINFSFLASPSLNKCSQRNIINKSNQNLDNDIPEITKNETKIKTIIINNYFPRIVKTESNIIQKGNDEQKNSLEKLAKPFPYKRNFHVKPLKMSKIPLNTKIYSNAHSPTSRLNTIIDRNLLIIKKHLSPKAQMNIENNNKTNSFRLNQKNDSKIIEVNKSKYCNSPKTAEIPTPNINKNNNNKKSFTRNNVNSNYEGIKKKYNSQANYTITNIDVNSNNNSYANYLITSNNNDEFIKKKISEKKMSNNSLNKLKRNFSNENIKSHFISNIKNDIKNLNKNSINNENKCPSNKNKIHIKEKSLQLNINDIKNINSNISKTKTNSPLNTFNNNFIYTIFNKKNQNVTNKNNIQLRNGIKSNSSYNYIVNKNIINNSKINIINKEDMNYLDFPRIKVHKSKIYSQTNNCQNYPKFKYKINLDKILKDNEEDNKNKQNKLNNNNDYYGKYNQLLNSMSYNSIFNQNKNSNLDKKKKNNDSGKIGNDKKIKNIPKIKSFRKNEKLNININMNNKRKNECLEKYRCNSNSNINNKKIISLEVENEKIKNKNYLNSNRENYSNKIRNNSNRETDKNDLKYKMIKRLELNEFLNNIKIEEDNNKFNILTNVNNFNTSNNHSEIKKISRINTSVNINFSEDFDNNKKKKLDNPDNKILKNNKYSIDSKSYDKIQSQIEKIKLNKNSYIKESNNENKLLNLRNKNGKKIVISPKLPKNEKDLEIIKNRIKNMNEINNNISYKQIEFKGINKGIILDRNKLYNKENYTRNNNTFNI